MCQLSQINQFYRASTYLEPYCEEEHHFIVELGPWREEDARGNVGLKSTQLRALVENIFRYFINDLEM